MWNTATAAFEFAGKVTRSIDIGFGLITESCDWSSETVIYRCSGTTFDPPRPESTAPYFTWVNGLPAVLQLHDTATPVGANPGVADSSVIARTEIGYDVNKNPNSVKRFMASGQHALSSATYDGHGRITSSTDPKNATTTIAYSPPAGPVSHVTVTPPAPNGVSLATVQVLDVLRGSILSQTNPGAPGEATVAGYDSWGRRTHVVYPGTPTGTWDTVYVYTHVGGGAATSPPRLYTTPAKVLTSQRTSSGIAIDTHVYYDGFGRQREAQTFGNNTGTATTATATFYDGTGRVYEQTGPMNFAGAPGASFLTAAGSINAPNTTRTLYDQLSRPINTQTLSNGVFQFETLTSYQGLAATINPPDTSGLTATSTTKSVSDPFGRITSITEVIGGVNKTTTNTYTKRDELASITDSAGNVSSNAYNWLGWRTESNDPDQGKWTYVYDAAGHPVTRTDARGTVVTTTFDSLGRTTAVTSGATSLGSWVYDTVKPGQLSEQSAPCTGCGAGVVKTMFPSYSSKLQPLQVKYVVPASLGFGNNSGSESVFTYNYTYDAAGWQSSVQYPAIGTELAETVTTGFETRLGKPDTLTTSAGGGGGMYVANTDYNQWGLLDTRTLKRSAADGYGVTRTVTYDGLQRTGSLQGTVAGNGNPTATIQNLAYGYDNAQNITAITDNQAAQRECFRYDDRSRLTAAFTNSAASACPTAAGTWSIGPDPYTETYGYDAIGNITSKTGLGTYSYTTGGGAAPTGCTSTVTRPHAVRSTSTGGGSFGYDCNGSTTTRTVGASTSTLSWDQLARLQSTSNAAGVTSNVYDASGARVVRLNPDGSKNLYLPHTELKATPASGGGALPAHREPRPARTVRDRPHSRSTNLSGLLLAMCSSQRLRRRRRRAPRTTTKVSKPGSVIGETGSVAPVCLVVTPPGPAPRA